MPRFEDENLTRHIIEVQKLASYIAIPDELAMDYGLIPDTRQPFKPLTWRMRARWRIGEWRARIEVAWQVLRGKDIHEGCDR